MLQAGRRYRYSAAPGTTFDAAAQSRVTGPIFRNAVPRYVLGSLVDSIEFEWQGVTGYYQHS
jgi:hypothetical protein